MLREQLSIRLAVEQRITPRVQVTHHVRNSIRDPVRVTAIGTDHRTLFNMNLFPMISGGLPRVPSYHSLPATLDGARARTLQRLTPLQAPLRAMIRPRAVFMSELSQQAPIPKDNLTDFAVSTSAFQSSLGMNPRRKSGLNSASRSSS